MTIDWQRLPSHVQLEDNAYKSIFVIHPVELAADLSNQRLSVTDDGLVLAKDDTEDKILRELKNFLKASWSLPMRPFFVSNNFASPRKEKWGFELHERVWLLCTAISILTSKTCIFGVSFLFDDSVNPPKYYAPFISKESMRVRIRENTSVISKKEFETLQLIYIRLLAAEVHKPANFSKLVNAVRFFERIDDTGWFLQKIVHAFVGLESLFTDSSKNEVTYKVSMRTSYFLYPEDSAARRELFDLLRVAYDIRSSFVHGSRVDEEKYTKKLQKMKNNDNYSLWYSLPDELNKVLAGVLLKILINQECLEFFSGNPDSIAETEFYDKLVLGNR